MEARTAALPPVVAGELSLEPLVALTSMALPEEAEASTPPAQPAPSASLVATEPFSITTERVGYEPTLFSITKNLGGLPSDQLRSHFFVDLCVLRDG